MGRSVSKVLAVILTTILVGAATVVDEVEGGRRMKSTVDQPENFFGGVAGGTFPGPPGFATGVGFGPSGLSFCNLPGGCVPVPVPVLPTFPGVPNFAATGSPPHLTP